MAFRWWNSNHLHGTIMPRKSSLPKSIDDSDSESDDDSDTSRYFKRRKISRYVVSDNTQIQRDGELARRSGRLAEMASKLPKVIRAISTGAHQTVPRKTRRCARKTQILQQHAEEITNVWQ